MGTRLDIPLQPCLNPNHNDSTPSMAVYDHSITGNPRSGRSVDGQDKLQVFCFGCQYHAWVNRDDIQFYTTPVKKKVKEDIIEEADHTQLVAEFFLKRNFGEYCIPWGSLTMGNELMPIPNPVKPDGTMNPVLHSKNRPYMEWDLHNYRFNKIGSQRRYLDDKKPKTKYFSDHTGAYANMSWVKVTGDNLYLNNVLHICESWVDAQWVWFTYPDAFKDIVTILGTNSNVITSNVYEWSRQYDTIHLWFDGDKPGTRCAGKLRNSFIWKEDTVIINHTVKGKKVYEL